MSAPGLLGPGPERWFHGGGEGGDAPVPPAAWRRAQVWRLLLRQKRAEAEDLHLRAEVLRRQIRELERAVAGLPVGRPGPGPAGEASLAGPWWSPVPVLGYRAWRLTAQGVRGVVRIWEEPRLEAVCPRGPGVPHDAPGCRCGIYAFKEGGALWAARPGPGPAAVYGLVALTGRVVEHEDGYRGQRAEVLAVAVVHRGALLCRAEPEWLERLFAPGRGLAEVEAAGGERVPCAGSAAPAVEYLETEARRWQEPWISESRSG